jgi:hypothetical protein
VVATVSRTVGRAAWAVSRWLSGQPTLAQLWPVKQRGVMRLLPAAPVLGDALEAVSASVGEANP